VTHPGPHREELTFLRRAWFTVAVWAVVLALWIVLTFPTASRTGHATAAPPRP
jgi:hypothetical protein